mmetsp:Transcript_110158/g.310620  ORF Transcript_110158/g.310620 Transcript_110158/m.310620 type:complete len:371 (+) Transcript_110158:42-1154(+)
MLWPSRRGSVLAISVIAASLLILPRWAKTLVASRSSSRSSKRQARALTGGASQDPLPLAGCVALVTGASRGIGKGCALALAKAGCAVYITGRTKQESDFNPGTLQQTAEEISAAASESGNGGSCKHIFCDHTDDAAVESVFQQIASDHGGRLDVLVNNAYDVGNFPQEGKFWWDREYMAHWDTATNVGLRGHYMCSLLAARMMAKRQSGLMVSIGGPGGVHPEAKNLEGVEYRPAQGSIPYVIAKSSTDRMMADMAPDLRSVGVTAVSLWPGGTLTERILKFMDGERMRATGRFESPEFIGRGVVAMAGDAGLLSKAGKIVMAHELAVEYGFTDADGSMPHDELNMLPLRAEMVRPPPYWVPDWKGYRKP